MLDRIRNFFMKIKPSKRKVIQLYAALLYNANIKGFITGKIFTGDSKVTCLPGLNCYSCPGAIGACPLGSIQNALASSKTKLPTYVFGIILLYSIILGRTICGFLCPVGLIQELLYKIKNYLINKVNNINNSYVKSFILGDTSDIDEDVLVSFQENGINHLFAISGMHISLLTVIIYKMLKKALNKEIIIFIIISIFLLFYLFLINFSPSAIRASMLFILINFCKYKN